MMRLAVAAILLLAAGSARAACTTVDDLTDAVLKQNNYYAGVEGDFDAASVADLVAFLNALPPRSHLEPDEVVIYSIPDKQHAKLVAMFGPDGCELAHTMVFRWEKFDRLIRNAKPFLGHGL